MTTFDGKVLNFDPMDNKGNVALMERANEKTFDVPWAGKNVDGENIMISVNTDNITVETFQNNNWIRENIYWKDGTREELYHR
jgi:hypothetical protein